MRGAREPLTWAGLASFVISGAARAHLLALTVRCSIAELMNRQFNCFLSLSVHLSVRPASLLAHHSLLYLIQSSPLLPLASVYVILAKLK